MQTLEAVKLSAVEVSTSFLERRFVDFPNQARLTLALAEKAQHKAHISMRPHKGLWFKKKLKAKQNKKQGLSALVA